MTIPSTKTVYKACIVAILRKLEGGVMQVARPPFKGQFVRFRTTGITIVSQTGLLFLSFFDRRERALISL